MVFELIHKVKGFKIAEVWFADRAYDIKGVSRASFYWCKNDPEADGFKTSTSYYPVIDLTKSMEEIYLGFNGTTRAYFNRAKKENFTISTGKINEKIVAFHKSYRKKMGLNMENISPVNNTEHIAIEVSESSNLLVSHVYLIDDDMLWQFSLASQDKDRLVAMASRYLTYEAIRWGKEHGFKVFNLASIGDDKEHLDGIGRFKTGFTKDIRPGRVYTKTYNPILHFVGSVRKHLQHEHKGKSEAEEE